MKLKRKFAIVLAMILVLSLMQMAVFATVFSDVPAYSYYYDAVYWAVDQGVTNGTTSTTFSPDAYLTRGHIVTFLWRLAGSPMGYQNYATQFSDVNSSAFYFNAVGWAVYYGITNGTSNDHFSPNNEVKNKETITFMYRAVNCNQITAVPTTAGSLSNMNLTPSTFYYTACIWANNQGYLASVPAFSDGFHPNNKTDRAMAVYFFWEMKTGNSKVRAKVFSGHGVDSVGINGRFDTNVSGYYTKGLSLMIQANLSSGYIFDKWKEDGVQVGVNNPTFMGANRNRSWTGYGKPNINGMIQIATNEVGNIETDNSGYNINDNWCAAFSSWCASYVGLASGSYTSINQLTSPVTYNSGGSVVSYPYPVLRNAACAQQIAHFCELNRMNVSMSMYRCSANESTRSCDWSKAKVYDTTFIPKVGDFVFFDRSGNNYYSDHVGIVTSVSKSGTLVTITTIEGNTNGDATGSTPYHLTSEVGTHTYTFDLANQSQITGGCILGFGTIE